MHAQRPRMLVVHDERAILTLIGPMALAEEVTIATTVGADGLSPVRSRAADLGQGHLRMLGVSGPGSEQPS